MKKIRRLVIIPARGKSKRIKNKNIKNFLGKPIIYLHTSKSEFITEEALAVVKKIFIFIDRDKHNWENDLKNIINKPYKELKSIWEDKKIYRDKYDEEWLTGKNLHAGKLGAKYIKEFILQNT